MRAVIFDLYGTLLERPKNLYVYERLLQSAIDPKLGKRLALTCDYSLEVLANNIGVQVDILSLQKDLQEELVTIRPYPETNAVLSAFKAKGMKLGLISNLSTPYKDPFFHHKLDGYFDTLVFSCDEGLKKPQPEIYALACTRLGVSPADVLMVGDSLICDHNGPIKAGLRATLLDRTGEQESSISSLRELL